ncbi:hypothetical protein HMPREF0262_03444 [Clostridium sp. ATCC 29733]|nr:hypothetical protein HMPREF0262_03444 [Clostridium sp. ATCC 29733]
MYSFLPFIYLKKLTNRRPLTIIISVPTFFAVLYRQEGEK